jgi:hypothetical protein
MLIASKKYSQAPQKPEGMPGNWPWLERQIEDNEAESFRGHGWFIVTSEKYSDYLKANQLDFDNYFQNFEAREPNKRLKVLSLVKDEFKFYHPSKIDFRRHLKPFINLNKTVVMTRNGRPEKAEYFLDDDKICEIKFQFEVDAFNFMKKRTELLGYVSIDGSILNYWPIHEKSYDSSNIKDLTDMINERYEARKIIFDEIKAILNSFLALKYLFNPIEEDRKTYPEVLEIAGNFWNKYSGLIDAWFNTGTPKLRAEILADTNEPLLEEMLPGNLIGHSEAMTVRDYVADRIIY